MKKIEVYLANREYEEFAGLIHQFSEFAENNEQDFLTHYSDGERAEILNACEGIPYFVRLGIRLQMDAMNHCLKKPPENEKEKGEADAGAAKAVQSQPMDQNGGAGKVPASDTHEKSDPVPAVSKNGFPYRANVIVSGSAESEKEKSSPVNADETEKDEPDGEAKPKYNIEDVAQEESGDFNIG